MTDEENVLACSCCSHCIPATEEELADSEKGLPIKHYQDSHTEEELKQKAQELVDEIYPIDVVMCGLWVKPSDK